MIMETSRRTDRKLQMMFATLLASSRPFLQFGHFTFSNVLHFRSAKSFNIVNITSSNIHTIKDLPSGIDIRSSSSVIRSKENVTETPAMCTALEIECVPFQSNSFSMSPIKEEVIKKNSTTKGNGQHVDGSNTIFVPVNTANQTHVILKPINKTENNAKTYLWNFEWSTEIFKDGNAVANGILLDNSWVLVEKNILGNGSEPLREHLVMALFGNTKSHLNIESPYEQLRKVDCLHYVNESNVMLLHLERPVDFNRYILPSSLPNA